MAKMLLSSCPPLANFIHTDVVHVVLLWGPCQHPRNHCTTDSPLCFLHPQSHPKGNLCLGAGLYSPPLPFSGTHTATEPTPFLDPGFAKSPCHLSASVPGSPCLMSNWPHPYQDGEKGDSSQGACALVQLHQHGLLRHPPPSPAHTPAEAGPISLVFWMVKSTVYRHGVQAGRQQTKNMNRCGLSLDAKYSPWGMDFGTCGILTCWLPSLQLTPREAARRGWDNVRPLTHAPAWLSSSWGSTICHQHMPEQPDLTPSLLARQHRTFVPLLFSQVLPNALRKQLSLPASCPAVSVQSPPLREKEAVKLAVLCCRETEGWPEEHLPGSRAGCCRWLLARTACTWVDIAQVSASPRLESLEEAKVMMIFLERPRWGWSRYGAHLREVSCKAAGLPPPAWCGWSQPLLETPRTSMLGHTPGA